MSTYIVTWNPKHWKWDMLSDEARYARKHGYFDSQWNLATNFLRVEIGDRVFVLRQSEDPKGVVAVGTVTSEPWEDRHYADKTKMAWYVDIRFDVICSLKQILLTDSFGVELREALKKIRASGSSLKPALLDILEKQWRSHLRSHGLSERAARKKG